MPNGDLGNRGLISPRAAQNVFGAPPPPDDDFAAAGIVGDVGAARQKLLADEAQRRALVQQYLRSLTLPGRIAAGVQPATPGVWTEEDEFRRQQLEGEASKWAQEQAIGRLGFDPMTAESGLSSLLRRGLISRDVLEQIQDRLRRMAPVTPAEAAPLQAKQGD